MSVSTWGSCSSRSRKHPSNASAPIFVTVEDQWASGISGYNVEYRVAGTETWTSKQFTKGTDFNLDGLSSGDYDVRVNAHVDTDDIEKDVYNANIYFGDYSDAQTITVK